MRVISFQALLLALPLAVLPVVSSAQASSSDPADRTETTGASDKPGVLELVEFVPAPFAGQGIAYDPVTDGLVGVVRKKKLVIFAQREATLVR